jgi:hypothetical protein
MNYRCKLVDILAEGTRQLGVPYSFWHNPQFMAAIAELHGVPAFQLQVFKGDELFAILPVYERSRMGIKALVAPLGAYYQGICIDHSNNAGAARKLLDTLAVCTQIAGFLAKRYKRIHFKLNPENKDVRGFTWNGFKAAPLYTFRKVLSKDLPTLPDERKKYRLAQKMEMQLCEQFAPDEFIRLQRDLDKRKKHRLGVSYSALQRFIEQLFAAGLLKQFNVIWENQVVSSNIMLFSDDEQAYTLFQATSEDAMRKGAATFHSLELLRHLPEDLKVFDYCGANVQEVARFKAALGLDLETFYSIRL